MALAADRLNAILTLPPGAAWKVIVEEALAICSRPLKVEGVEAGLDVPTSIVLSADELIE